MKPSPHTSGHLTKADLEGLLGGTLSGAGKARVEKLLAGCELSQDAVQGYTNVPGAVGDIAALNKQIALKSGLAAPMWMNIATIAFGVALVSTILYVFWPGPDKPVAETPPKATTTTPVPVFPDRPVVELTPQAEHFVNPEAQPQPRVVLKQGTPVDSVNAGQPIEEAGPIEVAPPEVLEVKPVVPQKPEAGYNASIGFIFDLKVTEHEKYSGKTVTVEDVPLRGVSAEFEDAKMREIEGKDAPTTREVPAENFLNAGLKAFHDGRYGRCIEKMEMLRQADPNDVNALFYMGVSYVKLEMYGKAIPLFDAVIGSKNNVFHEEARWYKALALLGQGETDAAKQLLNEIAGNSGFYQQKAKDKLATLK